MSVQSDLLSEIETFLMQRGGMAETTFGKLSVNDGKFVGRLREGCNMTLATIERVRKFIKDERAARGITAKAVVKGRARRPPAAPDAGPPERDRAA